MSGVRLRELNSMTKEPNFTWTQYQRPSGTLWYTENTDYNSYGGVFKSMLDWTTPRFRKLIKQGAIVAHPCYAYSSKVTNNKSPIDGSIHFNNTATYYDAQLRGMTLARFIGPLATNNSGFTDFRNKSPGGLESMDSLRQKASISAMKKVSPPTTQSLVTLAELDKSVKLIGDTARKLAAAVEMIKLGKPDKAIARALGRPNARRQPHPIRFTKWDEYGNPQFTERKSGNSKDTITRMKSTYGHSPRKTSQSPNPISEFSNHWLEWRYGWGPMVMDIVSTLSALSKARDNRRFMVRGSAKSEASSSTNASSTIPNGTTDYRTDVSHSRLARAWVLYEVESQLSAVLNDFGVLDFPSTAWELIPFSFVVDWFIPVGDWIQAVTPKFGVNILTSGVSMTERIDVVRTATKWTSPDFGNGGRWLLDGVVGLSDSGQTRTYERTGLTLPLVPPIDVNLNVKRAIDSIALLSGAHSRNLRK